MSIEERELLIDALIFYKDEHKLDCLQLDENYQYYDLDENGHITYESIDVKKAKIIDTLLHSLG